MSQVQNSQTDQLSPNMPKAGLNKDLIILCLTMALSMTCTGIIVVTTGLTGSILAENKAWATLPLSLQFVGTMLGAVPASFVMRTLGRRAGFSVGQIIGVIAGGLSAYAIYENDFALFAAAGLLFGFYSSFWQQLRFAATEVVHPSYQARAISLVMAGGVAAAIFGPESAKFTKDLMLPYVYMGCFVLIMILCMVAIALLQAVKFPTQDRRDEKQHQDRPIRPLGEIISQPKFIVAALTAMVGYASMSLVMTATPISMEACGFDFNNTAFVIQWHILGMYVPSFFTGHLIRKFGVLTILQTGVVCMLLVIGINLSGIELAHFISSLVLLGVGWNFMFVGGTTLLTESYRPEERFKIQGLNDACIFGLVAIASLSAGQIQYHLGWEMVNLAILAPIGFIFILLLWYRLRHPAPMATAE